MNCFTCMALATDNAYTTQTWHRECNTIFLKIQSEIIKKIPDISYKEVEGEVLQALLERIGPFTIKKYMEIVGSETLDSEISMAISMVRKRHFTEK